MNLLLRHIKTDDKYFPAAMGLYRESFPSSERQPEDRLRYRIETGKSTLIVGLTDQKLVSIAITWNFEKVNFMLLDYLAVSPSMQGKSIGGQVLAYVLQTLPTEKRLVIEVEDPTDENDRETKLKRIRFYLKNGAFLLKDVPYLLPSLDRSSPVPMRLMVAPGREGFLYEKQDIVRLIENLHREIYLQTDSKLLDQIKPHIPAQTTMTDNTF